MPALSRCRALLIDMGGVLLDMRGTSGLPEGRLDWRGREALLALLRRKGAELEPADLERRLFAPWRARYEQRYERGREASWGPHLRRLRRGTGVRSPDLVLLRAWFRPYADRLRRLPGAATALSELAGRGLRLALVSNVPLPGRLYREVLERQRLVRHFDSFHFSYDAGSRKPSPAMLRAALSALGSGPSQAVMVGDRRESDVAAGRAAGMRTVWVRSRHAQGPEADFEIGALAELPRLLDRSRG